MSLPKINPNYYAIIPASVRYDRELSAAAKLLYGEIAALSNQEGFCWASNTYFARLYETTPRNVRRWIAELVDRGYVHSDVETAQGSSRNLYLTEAMEKNVLPPGQNRPTPPDENVLHNNKTNNKKNTIRSEAEATNSQDAEEVRKIYRLYLKCFKLSDTVQTIDQAEKRYKLTDGRRAAIRRRLDDAGAKMLAAAIVGYSREAWYTGDNDRGWTADLEKFICRSYEKVEEGANKFESQSKTNKTTNDPWNM